MLNLTIYGCIEHVHFVDNDVGTVYTRHTHTHAHKQRIYQYYYSINIYINKYIYINTKSILTTHHCNRMLIKSIIF